MTVQSSLMQRDAPAPEAEAGNDISLSKMTSPQQHCPSINTYFDQAPMIVAIIERGHEPQTLEFSTTRCNKAAFAILKQRFGSSGSEIGGRVFIMKLAPYARAEEGNIVIDHNAEELFSEVLTQLGLPSNEDILERHLEKGSNPFRNTYEVTTARMLSQLTPKRDFTASYHETRQINRDTAWRPDSLWNSQSSEFGLSCSGTGRQIQVVAEDDITPSIIVPRKCTFWQENKSSDGKYYACRFSGIC
jgi:hypothetical protein